MLEYMGLSLLGIECDLRYLDPVHPVEVRPVSGRSPREARLPELAPIEAEAADRPAHPAASRAAATKAISCRNSATLAAAFTQSSPRNWFVRPAPARVCGCGHFKSARNGRPSCRRPLLRVAEE